MAKQKLVVIGNGMAAMRTVEELLAIDAERYDITVIGEEPRVNYNRIMLSPLLAGETTFDDIVLNTQQWYAANNIALHTGQRITDIDRSQQTVTSNTGLTLAYDRLLLATGSNSFIVPIPGNDLPGVVAFRTVDDVDTMLDKAAHAGNAIVIGGGLLGLEAAYGLSLRGMTVTVLHRGEWLMERQLDQQAGEMLRANLEGRGINIITEANTSTLLGDDHVTGAQLDDGTEIPADLVVMAAGIIPNISVAQSADLICERAVVVDDHMCTSDPHIFAVGECAQHRGTCYGVVAPIWDQAKVCATHLAENEPLIYEGSKLATTLKVSGIDVYSAGDFFAEDDCCTYTDASAGIYKKLVFSGQQLIGVVLYGDVADGTWYFELIKQHTDVSAVRERLIFGKAYATDLTTNQLAA